MTSPIIHHISVINKHSKQSFFFYHELLGLEFILKTVNQDAPNMYHLFFGDTEGRPGTEFTVFEMKNDAPKRYGTNSIMRIIFAVPSLESLHFWKERLDATGICTCDIEHYNQSYILRFEDQDGVQLALIAQAHNPSEQYYIPEHQQIPLEHAIYGIHSVHCLVKFPEASAHAFKQIFDLDIVDQFLDKEGQRVLIIGKDKARFNQQIHLLEDKSSQREISGIGSIHHVAINVPNYASLLEVEEKVLLKNLPNSGIKNREFFQSIYYREPNHLLIEVATEETSFTKQASKGATFEEIPLYLPPFLEPKRESIIANLS